MRVCTSVYIHLYLSGSNAKGLTTPLTVRRSNAPRGLCGAGCARSRIWRPELRREDFFGEFGERLDESSVGWHFLLFPLVHVCVGHVTGMVFEFHGSGGYLNDQLRRDVICLLFPGVYFMVQNAMYEIVSFIIHLVRSTYNPLTPTTSTTSPMLVSIHTYIVITCNSCHQSAFFLLCTAIEGLS